MLSGPDLFGWAGGTLAAMAYVLVSMRRIVPDSALFQGLNMVGASMLCVASLHSGALPSACLNIAWILFGLQSLVVTRRRRRWLGSTSSSPAPVTGPELAHDLADAVRGAA